MSRSNCFLTCLQISKEAGKVVWNSHLLKNFPQFVVIQTVKGFGVINTTEVEFFWNSLAFSVVQQMLAIWSPIPLPFSKSSLNIWKFIGHVLLRPGLENFECYFTSVWDECNCVVVWAFFGIAFLWDWNENTFSSPVATAEFSKFAGILSAALSQNHLSGFEIAQPITSTGFVHSNTL